jgi:hypothetical protein
MIAKATCKSELTPEESMVAQIQGRRGCGDENLDFFGQADANIITASPIERDLLKYACRSVSPTCHCEISKHFPLNVD